MKKKQPALVSNTAVIGFVMLFSAVVSCGTLGNAAEKKASKEASAPAQVYTSKETAEFKKLTKETLEALAAGKQSEAVGKITDLETIWDEKENTLKPKDAATWTLIDKTLDRGISALRSTRTNPKKGKAALEELQKLLEQATKP